jgi:hypothetical protein
MVVLGHLQNHSGNLPCRHVYHIQVHRGLQKQLHLHLLCIHVVQEQKELDKANCVTLLSAVSCIH